MSWDEFRSTILEEASKRPADLAFAGTMFLGGLSVGAVMPIMPILVSELGLGRRITVVMRVRFCEARRATCPPRHE